MKLLFAFSLIIAMIVSPYTLIEASRSSACLFDTLFPEQRAAVEDPNKKKVIWTSSRGGKTCTILTDFMDKAMKYPFSELAFIALTRQSAEKIVWNEAKRINQANQLPFTLIDSKLEIRHPNGSKITLYGADKPGFLDKMEGQKLRGAAIDEAARYKISIGDLIEDVLEYRTSDLDGTIYLTSTPGKLPRGIFYHLTKHWSYKEKFSGRRSIATKECMEAPEWTVHRWTTFDNPYMRERYLALAKKKIAVNPDVVNDPRFIRNVFGGWAMEDSELVYKYNAEKNTYNGEMGNRYSNDGSWISKPGDNLVLGMDFGYDDHQAFSLNLWREDSPYFVEIESVGIKEMLLDDVYAYHMGFQKQYGDEISVVGDPAHKQIFEEYRRRYEVSVIPGEKPNKFDWISTLNTDYNGGFIKIMNPETSPHVDEMTALTWHVKRDGFKIEQPGQKNDCCDAHLLSYRHSYHYRYEEVPEAPAYNTPEFWKEMEHEMLKKTMLSDGVDPEAEYNEYEDDDGFELFE